MKPLLYILLILLCVPISLAFSTNPTDYYYNGSMYFTDGIGSADIALNGAAATNGSNIANFGWEADSCTRTYSSVVAYNGTYSIISNNCGGNTGISSINNATFTGTIGLRIYEIASDPYFVPTIIDMADNEIRMGFNSGVDGSNYYWYEEGATGSCGIPRVTGAWVSFEFAFNGSTNTINGYINGKLCRTFNSQSGLKKFWPFREGNGGKTIYYDDIFISNGLRPEGSPSQFYLNLSIPNPHNNTATISYQNLSINITANASTILLNMNFSLIIGGEYNDSVLKATGSNIFAEFNKSFSAGTHNYSINASIYNLDGSLNSSVITATYQLNIDLTAPEITLNPSNGFNADNSTVISSYLKNLTLNFSFSDDNLYQILINITNQTGQSVFSYYNASVTAGQTTLNYTSTVNLTYLSLGNYTVLVQASDSHTVTAIQDYSVKKGLLGDTLEYKTGSSTIELKALDFWEVSEFETTKAVDRYTFSVDYDREMTEVRFRVTSSEPLVYLPMSNYKAHFVSGKNWIDFEEFNQKGAVYTVNVLDKYTAEVTISNVNAKTFSFNSIGGLNIAEKAYKFQIGGVLDVNTFSSFDNSVVPATATINGVSKSTPARFENLTSSSSVIINASGYVPLTSLVSLAKYQNFSVNLTDSTSANIVFKDEETDLILSLNSSLNVISDSYSANHTATNGLLSINDLPNELIALRYSYTGYPERFYYFNFSNISDADRNITLYMVSNSSSTEITASVYDQDNNLLENVYIFALRYFLSNNSYKLVEVSKTNFEGETKIHLIQDDEYYKFLLYYPFANLRQTTSPTYIYDDSIVFQISTTDSIAVDYLSSVGVSSILTFNNNTNLFTWIFSDVSSSVTQGCLEIFRIDTKGFNQTVNSTCVSSTAGAIDLGVTRENGTTYTASAYVTIDGENWFVDGKSYTYPKKDADRSPDLKMGLLIDLIMTITFCFAFKHSIELGVVALPLPTLFLSVIGLLEIAIPVAVGLEIAAVILAIILNRVIE